MGQTKTTIWKRMATNFATHNLNQFWNVRCLWFLSIKANWRLFQDSNETFISSIKGCWTCNAIEKQIDKMAHLRKK